MESHKSYRKYLLLNFFFIFSLSVSTAVSAELRVAVSIAPLHSLVASIMTGTRQPDLIMRQNVSPHSYQLTPSKAHLLSRADLVFWIGADFERALGKIIGALPERVSSTALGAAGCMPPGGGGDLHIWLDPVIAICLVGRIRSSLARLDADHSSLYRKNAHILIRRLKALDQELKARLAPLGGRRYLVFHDAYGYFERRYGLHSAGFFRTVPDRLPGAGHIVKLRRKIAAENIECIFTEPGFIPAQIRAIIRETGLKTGILDPLGSGIKPGPDHYFEMMRRLARNLAACLTGK